MRKIQIGAALGACLLLAAPLAAMEPQSWGFAFTDLVYPDLGETTVRASENGLWGLTLGLAGWATADCGSDLECLERGVDGQPVTILQDLQIVIDVISAGVVEIQGQSRGTMTTIVEGRSASLRFDGRMRGSGSCLKGSEEELQCVVGVSLLARTRSAAVLELALDGTITLTNDGAAWLELGGVGQIAIGPGIFRTG